MTISIVYATYSGSTMIASQAVADTLTEAGHNVSLRQVAEIQPSDLEGSEVLILASPSWDFYPKPDIKLEGQPHADWMTLIGQIKEQPIDLSTTKCAVMGMGDSSYTYFCGAVTHLENLIKNAGGELITESLKIDGFFFNEQENTQKVTDWTQQVAQKL